MPDSRSHRGAAPRDAELFGPAALPALRTATAELSWLLQRGYASTASLKLVGDRHSLTQRQRTAVARSACSDDAVVSRAQKCVAPDDMAGRALRIDGFNVLTTLEVALSGGVVLIGRDGCCRDIAGVHGTYRTVHETEPALRLLGDHLRARGVGHCRFLLDSPVSNSGRLAARMRAVAAEHGYPWDVELVSNPDAELARADGVVATADREVIDRAPCWYNLSRDVIDTHIPGAFLVALGADVLPAP